jgi:catechol 2,3-dioxygenase-like lactoylglutathione lyase family enzyme
MLKSINISHVWVLDQDEALEFYVGKLGLEVRSDVPLGLMRWLTVGVPGDAGREILLELPGPPSVDQTSAQQLRALVTKGATGFTVGFTTDDCRKTFESLLARGVEFTEEPVEHFYGVDCALRDPFGNHIRIVQPAPMPQGAATTAGQAGTAG